mgnify:CR=1 FL=1
MKVKINGIKISAISSCVPKSKLDLTSLSDQFGEKEVRKIIKTTLLIILLLIHMKKRNNSATLAETRTHHHDLGYVPVHVWVNSTIMVRAQIQDC